MTTRSAFLASDLTAFATPFSETDLSISASIRSEGSTFCQLEYSSGYSGFSTCPLSPTETHSSPFQVNVWCGTLRCLPSLTGPSARIWAIFFAALAFSEIINRILILFITQCDDLSRVSCRPGARRGSCRFLGRSGAGSRVEHVRLPFRHGAGV